MTGSARRSRRPLRAWPPCCTPDRRENTDHHFATAAGTPIATKLQLAVPANLTAEDEIAEWVGHISQRIITAGGPGTTLTVHIGDGQ